MSGSTKVLQCSEVGTFFWPRPCHFSQFSRLGLSFLNNSPSQRAACSGSPNLSIPSLSFTSRSAFALSRITDSTDSWPRDKTKVKPSAASAYRRSKQGSEPDISPVTSHRSRSALAAPHGMQTKAEMAPNSISPLARLDHECACSLVVQSAVLR